MRPNQAETVLSTVAYSLVRYCNFLPQPSSVPINLHVPVYNHVVVVTWCQLFLYTWPYTTALCNLVYLNLWYLYNHAYTVYTHVIPRMCMLYCTDEDQAETVLSAIAPSLTSHDSHMTNTLHWWDLTRLKQYCLQLQPLQYHIITVSCIYMYSMYSM